MAISFNKISGNFELISSLDPTVTCDKDQYDKYLETLDEGILMLNGLPTRFCVKRTLDYKAHKAIKSAQIEKDGKDMKMTTAFIMEQVRQSLMDIKNPEGTSNPILYERDSDGRASKELVADLESLGIVMEIYTAQGSENDRMSGVKKS